MEANQAKDLYKTVWDILDEGYQYSAAKSPSILFSAKPMDFFRGKLTTDKYNFETQQKLLQIVEMWSISMGAECENQSLKYF
jgi:hypothetical protein